jgi:hypothetical protein
VLDGLAWLNMPDVGQVAQFAGIDPRTAGKLIKNCVLIRLVDSENERFSLLLPYPHKGTTEQKRAVVREALVRMPLLISIRQFLQLGESRTAALRKAAVLHGVENFDPAALSPLLQWADDFKALSPGVDVEELLDLAGEAKEKRHESDAEKRVVFLSHSSKDKEIIRRIATDLTAEGISVWLDEQRIRVGDSIPEGIAQGLAESDFFIIALSQHSVESEWVKRELNSALVDEISRRRVAILPVKLNEVEIPAAIRDKKYADFTRSYRHGFQELLDSIKSRVRVSNG